MVRVGVLLSRQAIRAYSLFNVSVVKKKNRLTMHMLKVVFLAIYCYDKRLIRKSAHAAGYLLQ